MARHNLLKGPPIVPIAITRKPTTIKDTPKTRDASAAGSGTGRQAVLRNIKKVQIDNWILGGKFKWSTKTNDPLNAKFYIFQIQSNGSYKLVG